MDARSVRGDVLVDETGPGCGRSGGGAFGGGGPGRGYQTRINRVLETYVQAQREAGQWRID